MQSELLDNLIRLWRNPVGILCVIKQMHLRIEIEEKGRPLFRRLWRNYKTDREPDEY